MPNRRNLLASGLAAWSLGLFNRLSPALAHKSKTPYKLPSKYLAKKVWLKFRATPGEIHVFPDEFALYWTLSRRRAIRYSVGVGRDNLYHSGTFYVGAKKEWPEWTPTKEMIKRQPELYAKYADTMEGGINNPLGARALYLHTRKKGDSYLRIHGTNKPRTIGSAVSNGCARLVNDQIIELYNQVPLKTKVVLHEKKNAGPSHS